MLSLAPCESFNPALLASEPAALAAWLRYRLARWLIGAPLKKSGWAYRTTSADGRASITVGGAHDGKFELFRDADVVELEYVFSGQGFEVGMTIPHEMQQTLAALRQNCRF